MLVLAFASACAKSGGHPTMAPDVYAVDGVDSGGGGYGEESGYGGDMLSPPSPGATSTHRATASRERMAKADRDSDGWGDDADRSSGGMDGKVAGPPVRTEPETKPTESTSDARKSKPDHGRLIVYTGDMTLGVYNMGEAMKQAEQLPALLGGYVQARREGYLMLKIPASRLQEAMDRLSQLGRVEAKNLQADDVTAEFVDLESRIRVLQDTQRQLLELLKQAKTVEEALRVRSALDAVTMELEVMLGRMRQLSSLIEFSTLSVSMIERGPTNNIPSSNDPFPWVDTLGVEATEFN